MAPTWDRDDVAVICRNRDLFARNHQGDVRTAVSFAVVEEEEVVVLGEDEKVVAVVFVPGGYDFRLRVAVGLSRVRVKVAPEPGLVCHLKRPLVGNLSPSMVGTPTRACLSALKRP